MSAPRRAAGDWQTRARKHIPAAGGYLSSEAVRRIERNIASAVPTDEKRAWIAEQVDQKHLQVPNGPLGKHGATTAAGKQKVTRQLATQATRDNTKNMNSLDPSQVRMHYITARVRKWIHEHTAGVPHTHLTPPMLGDMKKTIMKKQLTPADLETVPIVMAAQGEMTTTWRPKGDGSAPYNPVQVAQI